MIQLYSGYSILQSHSDIQSTAAQVTKARCLRIFELHDIIFKYICRHKCTKIKCTDCIYYYRARERICMVQPFCDTALAAVLFWQLDPITSPCPHLYIFKRQDFAMRQGSHNADSATCYIMANKTRKLIRNYVTVTYLKTRHMELRKIT
jgi:hypothetical protein